MSDTELEFTRTVDLYNAKLLWERYDADMDAEEADIGYCDPEKWKIDLGDGVTVTRMTSHTHPDAWSMGAGNFIFAVNDEFFAYLGISMVHDQLYIQETPSNSLAWHQACNRLLELNNIPYRVLHPLNVTVGYQRAVDAPGSGKRLPLMRSSRSYNGETNDYDDVVIGTNFMARVHGTPWFRCEPGSPEDAHLCCGFGVTK